MKSSERSPFSHWFETRRLKSPLATTLAVLAGELPEPNLKRKTDMKNTNVRTPEKKPDGYPSGALPLEHSSSLLSGLVKRYQVCWEVWPEYLMVAGKEKQVGFELELSGTPEAGTSHLGPGCPACRQVFEALHAIAEWILPKERRPSTYELGPFQQALRYSSVRAMRPDVTLSVKILHRQGFDQPIDQCEIRCLDEMKEKLKVLGACPRQWALRKAI